MEGRRQKSARAGFPEFAGQKSGEGEGTGRFFNLRVIFLTISSSVLVHLPTNQFKALSFVCGCFPNLVLF
jgi:hypothetical protein